VEERPFQGRVSGRQIDALQGWWTGKRSYFASSVVPTFRKTRKVGQPARNTLFSRRNVRKSPRKIVG